MLNRISLLVALCFCLNGFSYNQLQSESRMPHKKWGLSLGLGTAGNGFGIKPQVALGKSIALVMPISGSFIPTMNLLNTRISLYRIHGALGFKWHIGEYIDRDSFYLEPVCNMGLTQILDDQNFAIKPALAFGYSWIWDGGFIFSFALTAEYEFLLREKTQSTRNIEQNTLAQFLLLNQPVGAELSFGWLF